MQTNYRDIIQRELDSRKRRRPGYSLRAFARDLKVPAPKLSEILRGVSGISNLRAKNIAKVIGLTSEETKLFIALVEAEHGRSQRERENAQKRLKSIAHTDGFGPLELEKFKIISDWHHNVLVELTKVKNFKTNLQWMSSRLGISERILSVAVQRLLDFGLLIEQNKTLKPNVNHAATPSGIPSREIREHHSQILKKADEALEKYAVSERDFSTITMAIDSSRIEEARIKLKEFRRDFCKDIQSGGEKDRVYCLSMQFFPLEKGDQK